MYFPPYVYIFKTYFRSKNSTKSILFLVLCICNNIIDNVDGMNNSFENNTYDNLTSFYQNDSDLIITNNTNIKNTTNIDGVTELESTVSVTEDSDSPFQSDSLNELFLTPDKDICNCDLSVNMCDINCCCDPDCNEDDVQIFSECAHQVLIPDENYCYQEDIILKNNTIYKMVKNPKNSMLCIVHDNFKHQLRFRDMPVLRTHRDLINILKYKYKTTYSWDFESNNVIDSSELKDGSPIYVDSLPNKKSVNDPWSLPSSCLSDMCSCNEEVRYLRDFKSSCSYIFDLHAQCDKSHVLSAENFTNFCISLRSAPSHTVKTLADLIVHTKSINSTSNEDDEYFSAQLENICIRKVPKKRQKISGLCKNIVSDIIFIVKHDGSDGIASIDVDFKYTDVPLSKKIITQNYIVNFFWRNVTEIIKKSGNPGYQIGLPIIAATNGSDFESEVFSKTFYESGLSVLTKDSGSFCSKDRQVIKFGKNLNTGCILAHDFTNCKDLQKKVSGVLLGPNKRQVYVGVFGNANVTNPDDWTEVFHEPNENSDKDDNCFVSLGLKIQVVYAAVGTVANPQYKIVGVGFHDSNPEFVDLKCSSTCQNIFLWTSVSFFDVTLSAVEHYAKVPSIKANLPSDFFYPFLYGRSSRNVNSVCLIFVMFSLCYFNNKSLKN